MEQTLIVRGRHASRTFIPDGPLPDTEEPAELVITHFRPGHGSVADAFGTAPALRRGDDILVQALAPSATSGVIADLRCL